MPAGGAVAPQMYSGLEAQQLPLVVSASGVMWLWAGEERWGGGGRDRSPLESEGEPTCYACLHSPCCIAALGPDSRTFIGTDSCLSEALLGRGGHGGPWLPSQEACSVGLGRAGELTCSPGIRWVLTQVGELYFAAVGGGRWPVGRVQTHQGSNWLSHASPRRRVWWGPAAIVKPRAGTGPTVPQELPTQPRGTRASMPSVLKKPAGFLILIESHKSAGCCDWQWRSNIRLSLVSFG